MLEQKEEMKFRHELKYCLNQSDYFALCQRLWLITKRDPYAGPDGKYKVRSLYFDNFDNKALQEKINGVNNREKFRIRLYNEDFSFIKLEKKSKVNGLCAKQSVRLTKEQCEWIIGSDVTWMASSQEPLLLELYAKMRMFQLRPKTLVAYTREPFLYEPGHIRITLDTDVRSGIFSKDLLGAGLITLPCNHKDSILLEIKYDAYLPEIISDIIQIGNRQSRAYSKYAASRIYG